jgi:hypothetical protein
MAKEISTSITINASPEKVWQILTRFENYPAWNPFIKKIEGSLQPGATLTVRMQANGQRPITFKPRILSCMPGKELRWQGRLLFNGLFDGLHHFVVTDNGDGTVTFTQGERFTGILVPLFHKMITVDTKNAFAEMNAQLKKLAEASQNKKE